MRKVLAKIINLSKTDPHYHVKEAFIKKEVEFDPDSKVVTHMGSGWWIGGFTLRKQVCTAHPRTGKPVCYPAGTEIIFLSIRLKIIKK